MLLEFVICCARITTLIALERFFSGMFPHVLFEIGRIWVRILALVAAVELFPVMQSFLGIVFCCHCFHLQGMLFL